MITLTVKAKLVMVGQILTRGKIVTRTQKIMSRQTPTLCRPCQHQHWSPAISVGRRRDVWWNLLFWPMVWKKSCPWCHSRLRLGACVAEKHYGFGSLLYIKCDSCGKTTALPSGKRHHSSTWDVNTKLGSAMPHVGLGESDVNGVLATLNIPGITPRNLKKREREAGDSIETVATATCDKAIVDERASCDSNSKQKSVSYDAGWQTRSSGHRYASLSGKSLGQKMKWMCCSMCD
ncbi:uncharacterized protein LOC110462916 [Mizuhopecten yessoensis]|uniref:uncharacterized protein LOC110462916 n=1 Tax=Mizuhopecten yessoensis TaxID=6573 RepID=UPI000B4599B2|nr:uncharacterized protein LOC110462916 [Mizuhopecten yessoensis]